MAEKTLTQPYALNASTLAIAADDYTTQVGQVLFTPTAQAGTWRGIGGNIVRRQGTAEWGVTIGLVQDLGADSLARYLLDHEGEQVEMVFTPIAGGPTITASVTISPAALGGSAGPDPAASTVTLPVDGAPVLGAWVDPTP